MLSDVAKEFVGMKFEKMDGVLGVLLIGSTSLGYTDSLADIDLEIVATENLCNKAGGICGSQEYHGLDVWWGWVTLKELENALKDWKDDIDLWVYSKSTILYDPEHKVEVLLSNYRQYPETIWLEKLFTYFYFATGNAPYDSGKAIQRSDYVTAQLYLNQAMEYYTALIFILNGSFVPYRKWRLKEFERLVDKPEDYKETLRRILTVKNWSKEEFEVKQKLITKLATVLQKKLSKAGVSNEKLKDPWKYKVTYMPKV